jgi:dipeptidyl aminopeptidase/acylaminoacyl peptidase
MGAPATNKVDKHRFPFDRFASIRRYTSFDFLKKDSSWILYIVDTNGQFNLWRQRSSLPQKNDESNDDGGSGEREPYASYQLSNFMDDAVRSAFSSPIDNSIVFFADHHGTENFQIWRIDDAFFPWPTLITGNSKARYEPGAECFSPNGKYIAYSSNETNPVDMLAYIRDLSSNETFCITNNKSGWYVPGYWSSNSKMMNCSQLITLDDYAIWILDIEEKEMMHVRMPKDEEEKSRFIAGPWPLDGQGFYVITDHKREYAGLALYDINKSKLEWVLTPEHDIELIDSSLDGKTLAWTENVNGYSNIYLKNLQNGEIQDISEIPKNKGVVSKLKLSPDGKRIGIMMNTPLFPSNIFVIDIKSKKLEKITESLLGNIPREKMVQPESIIYKSFDQLEIQAFLYKPRNENSNKTNKKFGALLSLHGGPTAQERPTYAHAGLYQYLADNGIAVLAPNFRGSTGYGRSFEKKIYHDWGGGELKDLEYAVKWLLTQNWIDVNRIGVFGVSFGGFATLSCITRLPQYNWKAAVDIVGPSNLTTFTKAVPEHWKRFMGELVGDPDKESAFLKERSPITYVDTLKSSTAKLLIIQGANDPRVVRNESDQVVEKLRSKGLSVEYMVFEDEGHGFTKYDNLLKALRVSAEFLANRLSI